LHLRPGPRSLPHAERRPLPFCGHGRQTRRPWDRRLDPISGAPEPAPPPRRGGQVPLPRPWFDEREESAFRAVLGSSRVGGEGQYGRELERLLAVHTGARGVLALNSCTAALEIAVRIAGLDTGDEVILPSFTFVSTANAILTGGLRPVFADIEPVTFCLDPADVERRITPRTRAIVAVHYAGMA